ncbi:MAG TPA: nickel pincer cofactor biosynthesis protein LarB [Gemmatimonadaceae bacterium]|nr:nickel pincer cofactor biosynthesis protein LarB [Gemmatimonadaceae bacterium]
MTRDQVLSLLRQVADGALPVEDALRRLSLPLFESLDFATIDHHRALRQGFPEVIFGQGKSAHQVVTIAERVTARGDGALVTRADGDVRAALVARFPEARANDLARTVTIAGERPAPRGEGTVLVVTAGTSDLPVAEEAVECALAFGNVVSRLADVGVAGIHRLLSHGDALLTARVIVVVAGMDGALPSVVGGLVASPVIAVPTSVGYGANLGGLAALFTMLNSCASGVTVVNVDNGFGAAAAASRITHGWEHSAA